MSEDDGFSPIGNSNEARANIEDFVETHGLEGFLIVYFRQLFFRFVKHEFQSAGDEIDDVSEQLHLDTAGDDALQDKREQMKRECERWARRLVDELKEDEVVGEVIDADAFERLDEQAVEERIEARFHDTLEEWKDDELLDEPRPDDETTLTNQDTK